MASNKSLMVCEPLPDWLSMKRIIDSVDLSGDNLRVWRHLAIHKRHVSGEENQVYKRNCKSILNL